MFDKLHCSLARECYPVYPDLTYTCLNPERRMRNKANPSHPPNMKTFPDSYVHIIKTTSKHWGELALNKYAERFLRANPRMKIEWNEYGSRSKNPQARRPGVARFLVAGFFNVSAPPSMYFISSSMLRGSKAMVFRESPPFTRSAGDWPTCG